jgi:hypothetical protein
LNQWLVSSECVDVDVLMFASYSLLFPSYLQNS